MTLDSRDLDLLDAAIIYAVWRGYNTLDSLMDLLGGVDPEVVKDRVRRLVARGLLRVEERGFLFFKKSVVRLTEAGVKAVEWAQRLLRETADKAERALRERGYRRVEEALEDATLVSILGGLWVLPFLASMGLLFMPVIAAAAEPYEEGYEDYGDMGDDEVIGDDIGLDGGDF